HPEAVRVEDAAADAELRHFGDRGHAGVTHPLEARHGIAETLVPTGREAEARGREGGGYPGPLGAGARRGHEDAAAARHQIGQGLDALARDLEMRLLGTQRLALRIEPRGV